MSWPNCNERDPGDSVVRVDGVTLRTVLFEVPGSIQVQVVGSRSLQNVDTLQPKRLPDSVSLCS